jgi:putative ABC transport system substrate-binding protein
MIRVLVSVVLVTAIFSVPADGQAQTGRIYRVAIVELAKETPEHEPSHQAFRAAMRDLGYIEGTNLTLDVRWADNDLGRMQQLVDDVILLRPDVLLGFEVVAQAMRAKTQSIPIVLTGAMEPVKAGLALSLARPAMNVTGSTQLMDQLAAKHVEILREFIPRLTHVGQLVDLASPGCKLIEAHTRQAVQALGATFMPYYVNNRSEVERAFRSMERGRPGALLPCPSPVLFSLRELLFENAIRQGVALTSFVPTNVPLGVLFAYAATIDEGYQRAATYVDKIIKGARPGDLPIEQPSRFRFVINVKTAKAIGVSVPQSLLLRADHVIQ